MTRSTGGRGGDRYEEGNNSAPFGEAREDDQCLPKEGRRGKGGADGKGHKGEGTEAPSPLVQ